MFAQATIQQVCDTWPFLKGFILEAVGTDDSNIDDSRLNNILASLLSEEMECWISYELDEEGHKVSVRSVVLTMIQYMSVEKDKVFLIYAVTTMMPENASPSDWKRIFDEGWEHLVVFAKKNNCQQIVTYTPVSGFRNYLKDKGANIEVRYITFNL